MRYRELSEASAIYPIAAKYAEFNKTYFNNELPHNIKLTFSELKNAGGKAVAKIKRNGPKPTPMMIRLGRASKWDNVYIVPGTMKIVLSSLYQRSNEEFDALLLHEMLHIYFYSIGDLGQGHGVQFNNMRRKLSQLSGIDIPLKDDSENLKIDVGLSTVGVILHQKMDGSYIIQMMSAKMAHANEEAIRDIYNKRNLSITLYTIATPIWTKLSKKYPLARKLGSSFYKINDAEAIKDLTTNGHVLLKTRSIPYT